VSPGGRKLLLLVPCAALYGLALGSAHSWLYAARDVVKFPLLIAMVSVVCAVANWIAAKALGAALSMRAVLEAVLGAFADTSILLASLAPAVLFVGLVLRHGDDGWLGEYYLFFALNVVLVAIAGGLALVRGTRSLCAAAGLPLRTSVRVVAAWVVLALFVGGQAAFWLRPFFGLPATRGNTPPFCLGSTPDVRGATNFYEMVLITLERAPLPERAFR